MTLSASNAQDAVGEALAQPLTRREFLYYLWGASMAVQLAAFGGAIIWFALPRFREGEFGGVFTVEISSVPPPDSPPKPFPEGRFWLVNLGPETISDPREASAFPRQQGVKALYMVCVHLGCLYRWEAGRDHFECPCHGSKYLKSGTRIDLPANRNLDVLVIELVDEGGNVLARTEPTLDGHEGSALDLPQEAVALRIDTARRIRGAPNRFHIPV